MNIFLIALHGIIGAFIAIQSFAADVATPTESEIKAAVTKSLPLLEAGARGSMEKRKQCFTCHNQGLPIMAFRRHAIVASFLERRSVKHSGSS